MFTKRENFHAWRETLSSYDIKYHAVVTIVPKHERNDNLMLIHEIDENLTKLIVH